MVWRRSCFRSRRRQPDPNQGRKRRDVQRRPAQSAQWPRSSTVVRFGMKDAWSAQSASRVSRAGSVNSVTLPHPSQIAKAACPVSSQSGWLQAVRHAEIHKAVERAVDLHRRPQSGVPQKVQQGIGTHRLIRLAKRPEDERLVLRQCAMALTHEPEFSLSGRRSIPASGGNAKLTRKAAVAATTIDGPDGVSKEREL